MPSTSDFNRQAVVYRMGDPSKPLAALTFDDGPDTKWTPQILDILAAKGVKATFFVLGQEVEKNPRIAARIVREGHTIASHGYSHVSLTQLSLPQMFSQLSKANSAISAATGVIPGLLRPVGGAYNQQVLKTVTQNGFNLILWSVDPQDWRGLSAGAILNNVLSNTRAGGIILLHSGEGPNLTGTVQALPQMVDQLQAQGLRLVTVPELLGLSA
ncbi:polysaccharide deacetylase family protein [Acetonema longum]|uniref:polysaccharide deacetylase family protein n=1 Tax=Acetonema longum TaxID=2374 RepID=UPI0002E028EE|nr:polysaccharide deacetylase family protein [Acetonema longum]